MLDGTDKLYAPDAEQAVLGAVLYDSASGHPTGLADRLRELVEAEDFYEPVHRRIWSTACSLLDAGEVADAITIAPILQDDAGLVALGGKRYLVDVMAGACSPSTAVDYAKWISEFGQRRRLISLGERLAFRAADTGEPLGEVRDWLERGLVDRRSGGAGSGGRIVTAVDGATQALQRVSSAFETSSPPGTILSGIPLLDERSGGVQPGHFMLMSAASSIGKSLLAAHITRAGASGSDPVRILYVSAEMDFADLQIRWAAADINCAYEKILRGEMGDEQIAAFRAAMRRLAELPVIVREGGGIGVDELRRLVRAEMRRPGLPLGLVVVDPIGRIKAPGDTQTERDDRVAETLQDLARETKLAVLGVHHLKKPDERRNDRRPTDGDIRGSGRLFDYADEVLLLHRQSYWAQKEPEPDRYDADPEVEEKKLKKWEAWRKRCEDKTMEVCLSKRRSGRIGWFAIGCNVETARFWDLDEQPSFQLEDAA